MKTNAKPEFCFTFFYIVYNGFKNYTRSHMSQSKTYITVGQF